MLVRLALALALLAAPAFAQQAEEEIVVTGESLREQVRSFVAEVSQEMATEDQIARWDRRICPAVIGLRNREQAQFLIDRVSQRAFSVGLDVEGSGCRANVVIFVTADSDALARSIAEEYRQLTGHYASQASVSQGRDALTSFVETPRPVRWWHVSQTVTADGQHLADTVTTPTYDDGFRNVNVVRGYNSGRLRATTRQDFSRVLIIVDADEASRVQLSALGDYLAMVALAQMPADADLGETPSILRLFSREAGQFELSDWDVAYLQGLYGAQRAAVNAEAQQRDIVRRMEEGLRK